MTYEDLIERLDPTVYQNLKRSLELGKWPDGRKMTAEQRATTLEALIVYEDRHNIAPEERVGYIDRGEKAGTACDPTVNLGKKKPETGSDQFTEVKV